MRPGKQPARSWGAKRSAQGGAQPRVARVCKGAVLVGAWRFGGELEEGQREERGGSARKEITYGRPAPCPSARASRSAARPHSSRHTWASASGSLPSAPGSRTTTRSPEPRHTPRTLCTDLGSEPASG